MKFIFIIECEADTDEDFESSQFVELVIDHLGVAMADMPVNIDTMKIAGDTNTR